MFWMRAVRRHRDVAVFVAAAALACAWRAEAAETAAPAFTCQLLHDTGKNPFDVTAGDWNGDGRTDLAVSYTTSGSVSVFLNDGSRQYRAQPELKVAEVARGLGVGDFDRDGAVDLAVADVGGSRAVLLRNDGKGTFSVAGGLPSGWAPFTVTFADLNGNDRPDLVVVNESNMSGTTAPGTLAIFFDVGPKSRQPAFLRAGRFPSDVAIGDFDGKPGLDLAVSNWGSGDVSLLPSAAPGVFAPATQVGFGGRLAYSIFSGDLTGDGKPDLAVADVTRGGAWVLAGDGNGGFRALGLVASGQGTRSVRGGDLNGDGHQDLVTANTQSGTVGIALGKGGGEFGEAITIPVGKAPRMVLVRDLDADGKLDIAATVMGTNDVALLFQTPGKSVPCAPPAEKP